VLACLQKDPNRRPQDAEELFKMACRSQSCDGWSHEMARQWWEQHLPELTGPLTINATVPLASETPTLIGGSDGMLTGLGKSSPGYLHK